MAKKATIKDVARLANVSPSTVSRAMRNNPRISKEVREKINNIAKEIGFHPNLMARSLVKKESRIIGVLFAENASSSMAHPFYPAVLQGLGKVAGERKFHILLSTGVQGMNEDSALANMAVNGFASGLICLSTLSEASSEEDCPLPTVQIGHPLNPENSYYVDNDNVLAAYEATKHLTNKGHRKILFLGYDKRFMMMKNRLKGFKQALNECSEQINEDWIIPAKLIENAPDFNRLKQIFTSQNPPTAVLSMDDPLSVGLSSFLHSINLNVPSDVSIVSFNNTQTGQFNSPALTTIDVHPRELGEKAMSLLIDVIKEKITSPTHIDVPFSLIIRDSVASPKEK